jgi:hypothetical protein
MVLAEVTLEPLLPIQAREPEPEVVRRAVTEAQAVGAVMAVEEAEARPPQLAFVDAADGIERICKGIVPTRPASMFGWSVK